MDGKKVRMRPKSKDLKSQTIDFDVVGNAGQTDAVKEVERNKKKYQPAQI